MIRALLAVGCFTALSVGQTSASAAVITGVTIQEVSSELTKMLGMQGQLPPGNPDFDLLRITAGTAFGLPSPRHTTLTELLGNQWNVDSFFDCERRVIAVVISNSILVLDH